MVEHKEEKKGIKWVEVLLAMAIPLAGVIGTWAVVQYRVNAEEENIKVLYAKAGDNKTAITTLQANTLDLRNDVSDIKSDVNEIQKEQTAQGRILERILVEVSNNDPKGRNR